MPTQQIPQYLEQLGTLESQPDTQAERDRLVLKHLPLVRAIAVRVYESLPVYVDLDDLIHAGIMGLIDSAARYTGDKQITFQSFAKHRIKGAILDSLRDLDWASRDLRRRHKQLESITRELNVLMQRNPTEIEIAEKMGMTVDRWRQVALELRMVGLLSASSRPADDENQSAPDFPSNGELNPDVLTEKRQLKSFLSFAIEGLPERYKTVVDLYYTKEKTMREIGEQMGINESRVSQIHRAALDKMNGSLQSVGITSAESLL